MTHPAVQFDDQPKLFVNHVAEVSAAGGVLSMTTRQTVGSLDVVEIAQLEW